MANKGNTINVPEFNYVKSKCTKSPFDDYNAIKQDNNMLWILSRLNNEDEPRIPSWSGFQYLTSLPPALCKINVDYLQAITDSPTKYKVVYQVLLTLMNELDIDFIFLEVDQAVYTNVIDLNSIKTIKSNLNV